MKGDGKSLMGKPLLKHRMQTLNNAADMLLPMILTKVPPPPEGRAKVHLDILCEGSLDDMSENVIRKSEKEGNLMPHVSKMVSTNDKGRLYAF